MYIEKRAKGWAVHFWMTGGNDIETKAFATRKEADAFYGQIIGRGYGAVVTRNYIPY